MSVTSREDIPGFDLEALGQGNAQQLQTRWKICSSSWWGDASPSKNHNNGRDERKTWEVLVLRVKV